MESDKNIMPELQVWNPVERLKKLAHFLFDHITDPGLSEHANRGGAAMLDRELYDQQEFTWTYPDSSERA